MSGFFKDDNNLYVVGYKKWFYGKGKMAEVCKSAVSLQLATSLN